MIIILEGHDTSGKSSIAKALSKAINVPVFKVQRDKYNWDKDANLKYGTEQITQFLEQTNADVILDRFHASDYMYSTLFGRRFNFDIVKDIDKRLAKLDTLIVYCYKTQDKFIVDEEDKDFVNPSMYNKMTALYRQFAILYSSCKYMFLDTSDENIEVQINKINDRYEHRNI